MSTSGLASVVVFIIHGFFILASLTLLACVFLTTGKKKIFYVLTLLIVTSVYLLWIATKDNWKEKIADEYIGHYVLTNYKNCTDCIIELQNDNSYHIYNKKGDWENGTWRYIDDGDISTIEFNNGGQFGYNEYEYIKE
jgi:hypothetical protein